MEKYEMCCPLTVNTTRVCGENSIDTALEIYKIAFSDMEPNVVILVNKNQIFDGIAATPLVHFPINAPILFTDGNKINKEVLTEIKKLDHESHMGIQVILVGNICKEVKEDLDYMGICTHHITGCNHYETACEVLKARHMFENILIMSGEDYSEGIASTYWSAHHGDPILFVKKNTIPRCTLEAIKKHGDVNLYIVGSTNTVSKEVEKALERLDCVNNVKRISGDSPYSIAVNFAAYKDCKTEFGWGRNYKDGHAFTFGTLNHPMEIIAGVVFAHMGKHTPLLLIKKDCIPEIVEKYIKAVKFSPKETPKPPFMHGFILGDVEQISYCTQVEINKFLSIDHHIMEVEMKKMMMKMKEEHEMDHKHHEDHEIIHHFMKVMMTKMNMGMEGMEQMEHMNHMCHKDHEEDMHHLMTKHHHHKNSNKLKGCHEDMKHYC
ncbi:cell wall-binding repeat-containing protein [Clostridium sp. UBA4548]|uniref:cell wall-binding repeat-containing protein n=1 Tax=Clostridium sp. UBA4548 TaxID=1946361 RepID=UPI0025C57A72|nr:cell wall-binding repeat-containing protein [Clostridium sp. UBA4548]